MTKSAQGSAADEDAREEATTADDPSPAPPVNGRTSATRIAAEPPSAINAPTLLQDATPSGLSSPIGGADPESTIDVDAWIGKVIDGRYMVVDLLGEGGMGAVFVAEHLTLRKQVALKVIRKEFAGISEISARFAREAMATAKLEHPHVASALDYGTLPDGATYLVIQLVRGKPLRAMLADRSLPWPQACDIAAQIADALVAAHGSGIVHRDLKPDNVLVERRDDGRYLVKVVDFGIARLATDAGPTTTGRDPGRSDLTRMGMVMGTPGYMSPEQALGEEVDHRTDLYALGVVLWESIAGRPLFDTSSLTELIARQLSEAPPPLRTVTGQPIPEVIDQLIVQLLARNASGRPASAGPVRDTLRKLAAAGGDSDGATIPGSGFGGMRRTEVAPTVAGLSGNHDPITELLTVVRRRWREDRRSMLVLAGVAGLLLLLGIAGLVGGDDGASAREERPASAGIGPAEAATQETTRETKKEREKETKKGAAGEDEASAKEPPAAEAADEDVVIADESEPESADAPKGLLETASLLTSQIDILINGETAEARREAATKLKELPKGQVPALILHVADLELGKTCKSKKAVVAKLDKLGDPQALPSLRHLAALPKKGCGLFKASDCWSCLRKPLGKTIAKLAAKEEKAKTEAEAGG